MLNPALSPARRVTRTTSQLERYTRHRIFYLPHILKPSFQSPGFRRSAWQIGTWWSPPFPDMMLHAQSYARSVRIRIEEGPPIHHSGLGRLLNRFPPYTNLSVPLSNTPTPAITSNDIRMFRPEISRNSVRIRGSHKASTKKVPRSRNIVNGFRRRITTNESPSLGLSSHATLPLQFLSFPPHDLARTAVSKIYFGFCATPQQIVHIKMAPFTRWSRRIFIEHHLPHCPRFGGRGLIPLCLMFLRRCACASVLNLISARFNTGPGWRCQRNFDHHIHPTVSSRSDLKPGRGRPDTNSADNSFWYARSVFVLKDRVGLYITTRTLRALLVCQSVRRCATR